MGLRKIISDGWKQLSQGFDYIALRHIPAPDEELPEPITMGNGVQVHTASPGLGADFQRALDAHNAALAARRDQEATDTALYGSQRPDGGRSTLPPRDGLPQRERPEQAWRPYVWARLEELEAGWEDRPPSPAWPDPATVRRARALFLAIMPGDAPAPKITAEMDVHPPGRPGEPWETGSLLCTWRYRFWTVELQLSNSGTTWLYAHAFRDGDKDFTIGCKEGTELNSSPGAVEKFQRVMNDISATLRQQERSLRLHEGEIAEEA